MEQTPCPHCGKDIAVPEHETGVCPHCGGKVRFVDVPSIRCRACSKDLPIHGHEVLTCSCGEVQPADPARPLRYFIRCPRCRRRSQVPGDVETFGCPHCDTRMRVQDTL